jgi:hypothetical protein
MKLAANHPEGFNTSLNGGLKMSFCGGNRNGHAGTLLQLLTISIGPKPRHYPQSLSCEQHFDKASN